jgi:hypothetical protein
MKCTMLTTSCPAAHGRMCLKMPLQHGKDSIVPCSTQEEGKPKAPCNTWKDAFEDTPAARLRQGYYNTLQHRGRRQTKPRAVDSFAAPSIACARCWPEPTNGRHATKQKRTMMRYSCMTSVGGGCERMGGGEKCPTSTIQSSI